jgi:DNA-binding transcriptional LysR family regulator
VADGSASVGGAVKLHQVRCVVAAARRGSFRRAAAALNLQQSSVSRCVRELEDHLGALLFERGAGGVALTAVGVTFVDDAERALDHLRRAAEIAGAVGREARQTLRIGAASIPGSGFLPEALQAVAAARPRCQIRLHEAPTGDNLIALRTGALDLAVVISVPQPARGAEVLPLWRERLLWAVPAGDRRARRAPADWRDVGPDDLILPTGEIGDLLLGRLAAVFGAAFLGATCRAGAETALRLAAMGQGSAIVSAGAANLAPRGVSLRPIANESIEVSAVRLLRNEKPALRRLMAQLREMAAACDGDERREPVAGCTIEGRRLASEPRGPGPWPAVAVLPREPGRARRGYAGDAVLAAGE